MLTTQRRRQKTTPIQPVSQRSGRTQKPAPERTTRPVVDAFLNHTFSPILVFDTEDAQLTPEREDEREFLASLTHLANLYGWPLESLQNEEIYPYNIATYHQQATLLLQQQHPTRFLEILADDTHKATLATIDEMTPKYDVYYIPVVAFYRELKRKANPTRTALIESIMAYLYQVAHIPYYTDDSSYLAWQLECIADQYESEKEFSDEETVELYEESAKELTEVKRYGEVCRRLINRPGVLGLLAYRTAQFQPVAEWDRDLASVARKVIDLLRDYPTRTLIDATGIDVSKPEPSDEEDVEVRLDAVVGFIWDTEGEVYDNFSQSLDNEYQNGCTTERAKNVQLFDAPQSAITHSLDFETRLFDIIDVFCSCLYLIEKHEQRNEPIPADV